MANAADTRAVIMENMTDAGLSAEETELCMRLFDEKRYDELATDLSQHRQLTLEKVHKYTEQLDCLDYLTYILRKTEVH